jgi:hypothetical protein
VCDCPARAGLPWRVASLLCGQRVFMFSPFMNRAYLCVCVRARVCACVASLAPGCTLRFPHTSPRVCFPCADTVCPCINAATLALIHAGVSMRDFVVSCSAGYLEKTALLGALRRAPFPPPPQRGIVCLLFVGEWVHCHRAFLPEWPDTREAHTCSWSAFRSILQT